MAQRIILQWQPSSFYGWGVYGLNLALHWAGDPEIEAVCSAPLAAERLLVDEAGRRRLAPFLAASAALRDRLAGDAGRRVAVDVPVLSALAADFEPLQSAHDVALQGAPDFAAVFFERARIEAAVVERCRRYRLVVAGSAWNRDVLQDAGVADSVLVHQGIDDALFHPGARTGRFGDRFAVFSGGKLELRKGQDLVVLAFAQFARRHPEALLVTAWHSPWPQLASSLEANPAVASLPAGPEGRIDGRAWAEASGVPHGQVLDLGPVPNALLPAILCDMDAALFPSRAEGGTNLMAMEAMACGVPTILSANTGHLDLIEPGTCLALADQRPLAVRLTGTEGWQDSSIEEMVAALETLWRDRVAARALGAAGARRMARLTWSRQAGLLKRELLARLPAR